MKIGDVVGAVKTPKKTKFFHGNIERDTKDNNDYRRVLFTAQNMQLVLMSLKPGDEIGTETHDEIDQFIRVDEGNGVAILDGTEVDLNDGDAIIIPQGMEHNILNNSERDLKLYSIYTPPEHRFDVVQKTKDDDKEEHFNGKTDL